MCQKRVFSVPYFPEFRLNIGKCRPEKSTYLDTFHPVFYFIAQKEMIITDSESAGMMETIAPEDFIKAENPFSELHLSINYFLFIFSQRPNFYNPAKVLLFSIDKSFADEVLQQI